MGLGIRGVGAEIREGRIRAQRGGSGLRGVRSGIREAGSGIRGVG